MALWGNKDAVYLSGTATFAVTNGSKAITASAAGAFNGVDPGDVLIITSGTTTKNRVATKTSSQAITLADNFTGTTAGTLAHNNVFLQEQPKYVYQDSNDPGDNWTGGKKTAIDQTFGVDANEATILNNKTKGINTPGWVRYKTYTDAQGNIRHKAETLVAGGSMSSGSNYTLGGDAADDATVVDQATILAFTLQPESTAINVEGSSVEFDITVTANPALPSTSIWNGEWQYSTDGGYTWSDNFPGGMGANASTTVSTSYINSTLEVVDTTGCDGYMFRFVANTVGYGSITSDTATLRIM